MAATPGPHGFMASASWPLSNGHILHSLHAASWPISHIRRAGPIKTQLLHHMGELCYSTTLCRNSIQFLRRNKRLAGSLQPVHCACVRSRARSRACACAPSCLRLCTPCVRTGVPVHVRVCVRACGRAGMRLSRMLSCISPLSSHVRWAGLHLLFRLHQKLLHRLCRRD